MATLPPFRSARAPLLAAVLALAIACAIAIIGPSRLLAQIEGDRGIAPVVNTGDIEITGIDVDTTGKTAADARNAGWKEATRKAWEAAHGPTLGDAEVAAMVSAIIVEREAIGPHRYIARLGVSFDRSRAGHLIAGVGGVGGEFERSAAMLVIPVLYSGGTAQVYEVRGVWQKAWAEFGTGASAIEYVRPSGAGGDSLLITAGQTGRRSRVWWRTVLDQFGASDVLMPEARLERQWPGGPILGTFSARYGPDDTFLDSFTLTASDEEALPAMLNQALARFDQIYTAALARGVLQPDSTLSLDHPAIDPALAGVIALGKAREAQAEAAAQAAAAAEVPPEAAPEIAPAPTVERQPERAIAVSVQFASPDARAVDAALAGARAVSGVTAAVTTSIAIGGTSVMRVTYAGTPADLAAALRGRGWQVTTGGGALRIRK